MLRSNVFLFSFAALSTACFVGISNGARHGCRASVGGQETLSTAPRQNQGTQETAAIEPPSGATT